MTTIQALNKETTPMNAFGMTAAKSGLRQWLLKWLLPLAIALPLTSIAAEQQTFATPEAAVVALTSALEANDSSALIVIFGDTHKNLVVTGDTAADTAARAEAVKHIKVFNVLEERGADRRVLLFGAEAWPFPIPLVRKTGVWHFSTEEGVEELINRRVGLNERNAIFVLQSYIAAQTQYASRDRNDDGVREFARKIASSPGKHDGLYWPADESKGEELSPVGPLMAAESATYLAAREKGDPYRGYFFRILTSQGKNAPGGAYNYIINGRMIAGFGMVAYPEAYGDSGVMTFIVSHNGKVYQKDLGPNTAALAKKINTFDPGTGWVVTEP
ncbi:MAG: DUF2950 domain-containing protein [Rhodocyclaceae bacterium]|nr:DUF2950 domain-containing protein [Rhodocyclaceae bacterium]